jgi:DNA polymerase epsilon subunit 1
MLDTQGEDVEDGELIDYLSEHRSLTKQVDAYEGQKSTAISTAKRLAEFLGADMVKDKGLSCKLLVANRPAGAPVTERAIPTSIFEAEPEVMRHYLRRWLKDTRSVAPHHPTVGPGARGVEGGLSRRWIAARSRTPRSRSRLHK